MSCVKVTNPLWVAGIAPQVEKFVNRLGMPNISYHSMVSLFQQTAQFGGTIAELWVSMNEENKPVAFAHWRVLGPPHVGTVYMDYLYSESGKKENARELIEQFITFGKEHRAPWYQADAMNEKLFNHFEKIAKDLSMNGTKTEIVKAMWRAQ